MTESLGLPVKSDFPDSTIMHMNHKTPSPQDVLDRAVQAFGKRFRRPPRWAGIAPGRVNLIGEHTDYNEGFVLPLAVNLCTVAVGDRAPAATVGTIVSLDLPNEIQYAPLAPVEPVEVEWANYPLGVMHQFQQQGLAVPPLDLMIASSIPVGSGLSSSAALSMSVLRLIAHAAGVGIDPMTAALWCQLAEHDFAGVPCGIMDPTASALGRAGCAILIDCRTHVCTPVLLPQDSTLLVLNSCVRHSLAAGEYASRRCECEAATRTLANVLGRSLASLRDVALDELTARRGVLPDVQFRRARHVITENQRVLDAVRHAQVGDALALGARMWASHASLRDDYQVSCVELDALVDSARTLSVEVLGASGLVFGARMTGGGFGGCAIALIRQGAESEVASRIGAEFHRRFDRNADIFPVQASAGARACDLRT